MFLQRTNVDTRDLVLSCDNLLALRMTDNLIPRSSGPMSVGSRRYKESETLAFEAIVEREDEETKSSAGLPVDHPCNGHPLLGFLD